MPKAGNLYGDREQLDREGPGGDPWMGGGVAVVNHRPALAACSTGPRLVLRVVPGKASTEKFGCFSFPRVSPCPTHKDEFSGGCFDVQCTKN